MMRLRTLASLALAACAPAAPGDGAAAQAADGALAPFAGRWNLRAVPEGVADTTPTLVVLEATASGTGWTMNSANRAPVPVRVVAAGGDSIVTATGPYAALRRPGVQVSTRAVYRLREGRLIGRTVARYQSAGADSLLVLRVEGTRAP
jgi:hypothetical protein